MISAVVVSYRSGDLAAEAIASLRSEAHGAGIPLEVIAVVNSGDPDEVARLRGIADETLDPGRNLGFAGGLNHGISSARGDLLALANPDIVLKPESLRALAAAVDSGDRVLAGPAYYWDDAETLFLPPAEEPRPAELVRMRCAAEGRGPVFRRDVRRAQRSAKAARRGEATAVSGLWGALLVLTRRTLDAVGPFDEGYPLYYEENDWQRRLRAVKGRLVRVGGARVVHRFNQSARLEPRTVEWFALSERRYFVSHFGERGARALELLRSAVARGAPASLETVSALRWPRRAGPVAVAVSPTPAFRPFAYAPLPLGSTAWELPAGVRAGLDGAWYARAFDEETVETLAEARIV